MDYKSSKYNFIYYKNDKSYWFNGIYHSCLRMSQTLGKKFELLLKNSNLLNGTDSNVTDILVSGGFIIPSDVSEMETIRDLYNQSVEANSAYLIILPTLNCNFSCHYCTQSHIVSLMSNDTIKKVQEYIKYLLYTKKVELLNIEWFGGEPFLYFNKIIEPISRFAISECKKANIPYINSATTNGSLITPAIAQKLSELKFEHFQITFDGDRELHNSIKFGTNIKSAFDTTLSNIVNILTFNKEAKVTLRINYNTQTLQSDIVSQIANGIPFELRDRIKITLKKIWQEIPDKKRFKLYLEMLDKFEALGFNVLKLDVIYNFMPCYVNRKLYTCINYNGDILKCTNNDSLFAPDASMGDITETGEIEWHDDFNNKNAEPSFENSKCVNCKLLPMCMGHCPQTHLNNTTTQCKMTSLDINIREAIISHIDTIYKD